VSFVYLQAKVRYYVKRRPGTDRRNDALGRPDAGMTEEDFHAL
jgi:hypothetical protein